MDIKLYHKWCPKVFFPLQSSEHVNTTEIMTTCNHVNQNYLMIIYFNLFWTPFKVLFQ